MLFRDGRIAFDDQGRIVFVDPAKVGQCRCCADASPCTNPIKHGKCCFSETSKVRFRLTSAGGSCCGSHSIDEIVPINPPSTSPAVQFSHPEMFLTVSYFDPEEDGQEGEPGWSVEGAWSPSGCMFFVPRTSDGDCCGLDVVREIAFLDANTNTTCEDTGHVIIEVLDNGCCRDGDDCIQGDVDCPTGECNPLP